MVCLGAQVHQEPPHEVGEGVGAEQDGVRDVGQNIDQEVLSWVTVVRGKGNRGRPLVVDLKYIMENWWAVINYRKIGLFVSYFYNLTLTTKARSQKGLAINAFQQISSSILLMPHIFSYFI